jgi:diacylglycerol O-acyltransferase
VPADAIAELAQVSPPLVATAAMRLQSRLRLSDRMNLPVNVTISNVPGPREALYFAGAKMDNYIPVSIVTDDMGLNITVHSYLDRLDFGLIADRDLVPDLWDMVDMHIDEIGRLFEATGAEWAEEQPPPAMRRGNRNVTAKRLSTTVKKPAAAKKKPAAKKKKKTARKPAAQKKKTAPKKRPAAKKTPD